MRLFLALSPPEESLDELERTARRPREQHPELRWAARASWHITLVFLGDVAERPRERLHELVGEEIGHHRSMVLSLLGVGTFPEDAARGRVLWVGVGGDVSHLGRLAGGLARAAEGVGIRGEDRPYVPHLTLARSKRPRDMREVAARLTDFEGMPWRSAEVCLVHSVPGPRPRYETIATWRLEERERP